MATNETHKPAGPRTLVTGVGITRLRGIRQGTLDGLAPLTILVGQNGSGKSTVLDALLIAAGTSGPKDLRRVIERRRHLSIPTPWLTWRAGVDGASFVHVLSGGPTRYVEIAVENSQLTNKVGVTASFSWSEDDIGAAYDEIRYEYDCAFDRHGPFSRGSGDAPPPLDRIRTTRLIEPAMGSDLHILLSEATRQGGRRTIERLLASVIDDLLSVQMLVNDVGKPEVHLEFDWGSVPVAVAGDGLHALTRLAFMIAAPSDALLLIEEPEVHMHPRALQAAARAMVGSVKAGNQIITSTHSLDLIDHVLDAAAADEVLDDVAVFRTLIVDGELRSSRFPGEEARFARQQIEEDLR